MQGKPDFTSPHHGSAVGKLLLAGELDSIQMQAAKRYASLRGRYLVVIGAAKETAKAMDPGQESLARPLWSQVRSDEDELQAEVDTRHAWADAFGALQDVSRVYFGAAGINTIPETVRLAIVEDVVRDIGNLRVGLNQLASLWGMRKATIC